ncbi:unnamed protein product [Boreogadus saida]
MRPPRRRPRALSSPLQQALAVLSSCGRSEWVQAPAALPAANNPTPGWREREQPGQWLCGRPLSPVPPLFLARGKRAGMAVAAASLREH